MNLKKVPVSIGINNWKWTKLFLPILGCYCLGTAWRLTIELSKSVNPPKSVAGISCFLVQHYRSSGYDDKVSGERQTRTHNQNCASHRPCVRSPKAQHRILVLLSRRAGFFLVVSGRPPSLLLRWLSQLSSQLRSTSLFVSLETTISFCLTDTFFSLMGTFWDNLCLCFLHLGDLFFW